MKNRLLSIFVGSVLLAATACSSDNKSNTNGNNNNNNHGNLTDATPLIEAMCSAYMRCKTEAGTPFADESECRAVFGLMFSDGCGEKPWVAATASQVNDCVTAIQGMTCTAYDSGPAACDGLSFVQAGTQVATAGQACGNNIIEPPVEPSAVFTECINGTYCAVESPARTQACRTLRCQRTPDRLSSSDQFPDFLSISTSIAGLANRTVWRESASLSCDRAAGLVVKLAVRKTKTSKRLCWKRYAMILHHEVRRAACPWLENDFRCQCSSNRKDRKASFCTIPKRLAIANSSTVRRTFTIGLHFTRPTRPCRRRKATR